MGGGGSKAAAMQKGAARAAAVGAAKPPPAAAAVAAEAGISAAERQREAALRQQRAASANQPAEQRQDNAGLERSMNQAMAGMRQYQYALYRNPEVDARYAVRKKSREEREAELVGRLDSDVLMQLLGERARSVEAGRPIAAAELARKYGANPEVLERVLRHVSAPIVREVGGQLVGSWPGQRGGKDEE